MNLREIFPKSRNLSWQRHSFLQYEYDDDRCNSPPLHTPRGVFCNGHASPIDTARSVYFTSNHLPEVQHIIRTMLARAGIITTAYEDAAWLHSPNHSEYTRRNILANNADHIIIAHHPWRDQADIAFELGYISQTAASIYIMNFSVIADMIAAAALESPNLCIGAPHDVTPTNTAWTEPDYFGISADAQHIHLVGLDITGTTCLQLQLPNDHDHDLLAAHVVAAITAQRRTRYVPNHFQPGSFAEHLIKIAPHKNIQHVDERDLNIYQQHERVHPYQLMPAAEPIDTEAHAHALVLAISAFHDQALQYARDNRTTLPTENLLTLDDNATHNKSSQPVVRGIYIAYHLADVVTLDAHHRIVSLEHSHITEIGNPTDGTAPYTIYAVGDDTQHYLQPNLATKELHITLQALQDLTSSLERDLSQRQLTITQPLLEQIENNGIHLVGQTQIFALALANAAYHQYADA